MYNTKTLELEILIAVSQNKKVPANQFSHLFEHKWKLYESAVNDLLPEKLFEILTIDDTRVYGLTSEGKNRLGELIEQREKIIAARVQHLKQERPLPVPGRKSLTGLLNSLAHFWAHPGKMAKSGTLTGHKA
jgi:hypothetical protein